MGSPNTYLRWISCGNERRCTQAFKNRQAILDVAYFGAGGGILGTDELRGFFLVF